MLCEVGYRTVERADYFTPYMYLPMQRTCIDVAEPCGEKEAVDAILADFPAGWFESRDAIRDVECWPRK